MTNERVNSVARVMVQAYNNDETIYPYARAAAYYAVVARKIDADTLIEKMSKAGARECVGKLLRCISSFAALEPRALGIELATKANSSNMQKSLDVKHFNPFATAEAANGYDSRANRSLNDSPVTDQENPTDQQTDRPIAF